MPRKKKEKRPIGRPPISGGGRMVTLYLQNSLADKLKLLGGSEWVAKQIKKARVRNRDETAEAAEVESEEKKNGSGEL
jgi:hypothetical protein